MTKEAADQRKLAIIVIIVLIVIVLLTRDGDPQRQPYWDKIDEYQPTIKPEMIMSIAPSGGYSGKPIIDWKLDELALAMSTALGRTPSHPVSYGLLDITLDTMGTGIKQNIWFSLATEHENFIVYFTLQIMKDGESYARGTFMGEALNEWARSVGIADKENW